MIRYRLDLVVGFVSVALAVPVLAQSAKPAPPTAPTPTVDATRPDGSLIRCKDGSWAPKGATPAACDTHQGMAYRLPEITPPPAAKPRPDANQVKASPPPAPKSADEAPPNAAALRSMESAPATAPKPPTPPPPGTTVVCKDGTYFSGAQDAARCDSHGGLAAFLPPPRRRP
jgi:hypothetical protein